MKGKLAGARIVGQEQWIFLDTLQRPNHVPGKLGEEQLRWLMRVLDAEPYRPALLFLHHPPEPDGKTLLDAPALLDGIRPRRQVKALFFGHTHVWRLRELDGLHLVNLPAVGYTFSKGQPLGWVRATPRPDGIALELRALGGAHPDHRKEHRLAWRPPVYRRALV